MPPRRELCRNFQRGSCQYGDRCKFLHAAPQQQKTNPFGFGMQTSNQFQRATQQQQAPNPFGFGVQNNAQHRGGNDFGSEPNQFMPFENKWTRFSPINANNASVSRKQEAQTPAASHKCTDIESCKRIIMEDFQNEKPLWKLTCYGHNRDGPCDITGDISCEELRALAYADAKSGKSLQFIIQREKELLNTKLVEFQNLTQKPSLSSNAMISSQSPFAGSQPNAPTINSNIPPAVSNFSQLSASLNTKADASPNFNFGQSSFIQNNAQQPGMFPTNHTLFNTAGTTISQVPQQKSSFAFDTAKLSNAAHQNPFSISSNSSQFGNANENQMGFQPPSTAHQNLFSTSANSSQIGNATDKQINFSPASLVSDSTASTNNTASNGPKVVDDSIWSKPEWKWNCGEIPEEAPSDNYIY